MAIAAAVAGKCQPCFAYHYKQAKELGVGQGLVREVLQLARDIGTSGDEHFDEFGERRMTAPNQHTGEAT